ncbi:MAG: hypothetical protein HOW97_37040 [Catenulispora sp.]|nr:hypothetical protein [Catenulispora sp.]
MLRFSMLHREDLPAAVRDFAINHPDRRTRLLAAEAGRLSPRQWDHLTASFDDEATRGLVADMRDEHCRPPSDRRCSIDFPKPPEAVPPSSPAEIAEWAARVPDISPDARTYCPWWIAELHDDPEAMRQLAASPNLKIRRSVARAKHLPPDVLERLAQDEDRVVRLFLTESCDDTPAEVLVEVWGWWPGSFSYPGRPRDHPNFPKTGLLHYADDPNPRMRLLAVYDPAADNALIDRLAADPDPQVQYEAIADPRVSVAVLAKELLGERFARAAAANPALPVPVMRRMIDVARRAGLPR